MVLPSLETAYQNKRINMARLRGLKIKVICVIYHITFRVETIHNNLRGLKILLATPHCFRLNIFLFQHARYTNAYVEPINFSKCQSKYIR